MDETPLAPVGLVDGFASTWLAMVTGAQEAAALGRLVRRRLGADFERGTSEGARAVVGALLKKRAQLAGAPAQVTLEAYRGFGSQDRAYVTGRVAIVELGRDPGGQPTPDDSTLDNIGRILRGFLAYGIANASVRVRVGQAATIVTTDAQGYFHVALAVPPGDAKAKLELVGCPLPSWTPARTVANVMVPDSRARCIVVSDIDDTLLRTHADGWLRMTWLTLTGNALTRQTFAGAPAFIRALHAGQQGQEHNPCFYVSRSPWNLYEFLVSFLQRQGFPEGPLLLRGLGRGQPDPTRFKVNAIEPLLAAYPNLPFVLLGDSGEDDPATYLEIARRHPGRVKTIYLRDLGGRLKNGRFAALCQAARHLGSDLVLLA